MTTRLIEAAKAVLKRRGIARYGMASTRGEFDAARVDDDFHQLDAAISDAEQQAADDAEAVTEWWFNNHFGGHVQLTDTRFISWDTDGLKLYCEDGIILLNDTKTRGQLRRLIKALKGGE